MSVDLGSAEGRLTLNASDFVNQINSAITELNALQSAHAQTIQSITNLETGLVGAGSSISTSASGISSDVSNAFDQMSNSADTSADNVQSSVDGIGTAAGNASGQAQTFGDRVKAAFTNLKNALPDIDSVIEGLDKFSKKAESAGKTLSKYITTPLMGIGAYSVKTAASFDASMSRVAAISGASAEDMERLTTKAREMGETTKFTASQSAEALNYMAMAGWKTEDMLDGLEGIMDLAAASGSDLGTASDIVTDALTAMGKSAEDSARLADIMAAAASNSNTNVEKMGETFKFAAPLIGAMGYTMEDTAVAVGLMANSGIKSAMAGTALRGSITRLIKPTKQAKEQLIKLGLATNEMTRSVDDKKLEKAQAKVEAKTLDLEKAQIAYNSAVKKYSDQNSPEIQTALNNVEKAQIRLNEVVAKYGEDSSQAQTAILNLENAQLKLNKAQEKYTENNPAIEQAAINLEKAQNNLTTAQKELETEQKGSIQTSQFRSKLMEDEEGNVRSLLEVMKMLRESFKGLSSQEKAQAASILFGSHAMSGMLAIINASEEDFNRLTEAIYNSEGSAKGMSEIMMGNLVGQLTLLKSKLESIAITVGEDLIPAITDIVDKISNLLDKFKELDPEERKTIINIGIVAAAIGPVLTAIGKMAAGLSVILKVLKGLGNVIGAIKASSLVTSLGSAFAKLGTMASSAVSSIGTALTSGISALAAPAVASLGTVLLALLGFIAGYGLGTLIYNALEDEIDEVLHPIFDTIVSAWDTVVDFFTTSVPETLEDFFDWVKSVGESIGGFFTGFTESVSETVEGAIESTINFFSSVATSVSEFFSAVWTTLVDTFTGISTWIDENVIQPVLAVVVPIVSKIGEIIAKIWEIITTLFSVAVDWISDNVIQPIVENIQKFVNKIKTGIQTLINTIKSWINSFLEFVSGFWSKISSTVSTFVTFVKTKFTEAYNSIVGVFNKISSWWQKNVVEPITQKVQDVKKSISEAFTNAWEIVTDVFDDIGSWFADKWSAIVDVFSGTVNFFSNVFSQAWDAIVDAFDEAKRFFSDLWDSIIETFDDAAETISGAFEDAFKGAFNGLMYIIEGLINTVVDAINSAVDVINEIPGVDIGKLDRLSLPRLAVGLDYVPYDGYQALLHKGERVLTKEENEEYNRGTQGGDTFIFNSPEPIDEVLAAQEMKRVKQELAEGF